MKKSLFKRVFATATAVPLALTQCLSVANAISVTDATVVMAGANLTNEKSVSVDSLAFIEPTAAGYSESDGYTWVGEKDADGMPVGEGYFEKNSDWNVTISNAINAAAKEGTIDTAPIFEGIINKAGKYSDIAKSITEKVGDVKYTISSKNVITVSAYMEDIVPIFEDFADKKVGSSLKDLAEKYDMPELANIKFFEGLNIEGDIVITIDASELNADTIVNGEISFTDKAGKTYKGMALADYARDQVEAIRDAVVSKIESLVSEYELTSEEIEQMVQDSDEYNNMITDLETGYKPAESEIESMILESAEFKKLVTDYMADHAGVSYEEAEAEMQKSPKYQDLMDRFSNGLNLSAEEIEEILQDSDEYNELVKEQEEAGATPDEAVAAVLESDEYKKLLEDYTDKYTYTREEIEEIVKGSDSYKNKLAEINAEYEEQYAEMTSKANAAKEQIENLAGPVLAKYEVVKAKYDTVKSFEKTIEAKNYADLANKVNNNATFKKYLSAAKNKIPSSLDKYASKIPDSIPTSLVSVASKSAVQKIFSQIVNQVASTSGIQIEGKPADIAAFVESFTDLTATFEGGTLTYTGKLTDEDETGSVNAKSYIEDTYEVEVSDFYKEATIVVDYATLDSAGNVSVDFQLKRIVEAKAKEKDTTTTTTTTSTSTSTTTSTTEDPSKTTTTTSTTEDPSKTTTTTSTTEDPSKTTTTSTTEDPSKTTTTTSTTEDPSKTTTTTTTTKAPVGTTTVSVSNTVTISVETASESDFYFTIDEKFNKDNITSVKFVVDTVYSYIDEEGTIVKTEVNESTESGTITDMCDFRIEDTPGSVFQPGKNTFKYSVALYANQDIVTESGVVIANEGEMLQASDGTEVEVTVYIGVKGDADLDGMVSSMDSSVVLAWYSNISTGGDPDKTAFSTSKLAVETDDEDKATIIDKQLDEFAAFLADVNNEKTEGNNKLTKSKRLIDPDDASNILDMYEELSTGSKATREKWNEVLERVK